MPRAAVSAASEWGTPSCPGGGGGRLSLEVSGGVQTTKGGFREGKARDAQGSLPTPCLWELGWEELEGFISRGGWARALPALGTSESLGWSRVQAGPVDLMGQDRDPGSGVRAGGAAWGCCSCGVPGRCSLPGTRGHPGSHSSAHPNARGLLVPCSPPAGPIVPGLLPLSPILLLRSQHCPFCCPHRRFCTGSVPRFFSYSSSLIPTTIPPQTTSIPK